MESYHKRKKILEEKYGRLINVKPYNDKVSIADTTQQKNVKQLQCISDEGGLKRAYDTRDGLYQHYNKLFIAGTKDFPQDHIDDLRLPFGDTLNKTKRGRDADAYYRSHHEIDTVIGHPLGPSVGLALQQKYKTNKVIIHMESFKLNHSGHLLYQVTYQTHYKKKHS